METLAGSGGAPTLAILPEQAWPPLNTLEIMEIAELLNTLTEEISRVPDVTAIVLGGSRARGTHDKSSDVDLGIYYQPNEPLDLDALNLVASKFDDEHRSSALTSLGSWGPWINGGGWLKINHVPVDFLYR